MVYVLVKFSLFDEVFFGDLRELLLEHIPFQVLYSTSSLDLNLRIFFDIFSWNHRLLVSLD